MKKINILFLCFSFLIANNIDVLNLKNGDIIKGEIIENNINEYIKIQLMGGSILKYNYNQIESIDREKNSSTSYLVPSQETKTTPDKNKNINTWDFIDGTFKPDDKSNRWGHPEKWYTLWGLGLSLTDNTGGDMDTKIAIDMLGFYWPINSKAIRGFVISGKADRVEGIGGSFQNNYYLYSYSYIKYNEQFGKGLYYRIDAGYAREVVQYSGWDGPYSASENGFGVLLGAGYSIDLTGTRILIGATHTINSIENIDGDSMTGYTNLIISALF